MKADLFNNPLRYDSGRFDVFSKFDSIIEDEENNFKTSPNSLYGTNTPYVTTVAHSINEGSEGT
jgi:hypothetical protein